MHQWKVILATVLIFGSGVGTGHFLSRRNVPEPAAPQPGSVDTKGFQPATTRPMMFRSHGYLDNHLKLTDEQKVQLREIRKAGHDRVREFGKPFREKIIAEDQRVREEIRALLTTEQARTFDRLPHFRINPEPGRPGAGRQPRTNGPRPPRPNPKAKKSVPASPQTTGQVKAKAA